MKHFLLVAFLNLCFFSSIFCENATFTPPDGWRIAETETLPPHVKTLVVGKGSTEMPPSMSLGVEKFSGTLKDYLKIVKNFNASQGDPWKDLGTIQTKAGPASLSQVEIKTEWGPVKEMHVIYQKDGVIYILTAAALKKEFANFYADFFKSLKSFDVN